MRISKKLKANLDIYYTYLLLKKGWYNIFYNDKEFFRKQYKKTFGDFPDLENPKTFFEKLIWSMLNHRNDLYIQYADKYKVREFVKKTVGEGYLVKCLNIYDKTEDINFDTLPDSFVLKATHGSGWGLICSNKKDLNITKVLKMLNFWLTHNYYEFDREWPYKDMPKRIICEEFIGAPDGTPPMDYKIFCFGGVPKFIQLDINRFNNHKRNIYDIEWNQMKHVETKIEQDLSKEYNKPDNLSEMLDIASKLSKGFEHVRIDLYNVERKIYFGEMTFFHGGGVAEIFKPKEFDLLVGSWFHLPNLNYCEKVINLSSSPHNDTSNKNYFDINGEIMLKIK